MDKDAVSGAAGGALMGAMSTNPYGLAIGAGVGLLQGLLSSAARREEERRKAKAQAEQMGYQTQANAAKAMTEGEQNAFSKLMSGYQSALLKGG